MLVQLKGLTESALYYIQITASSIKEFSKMFAPSKQSQIFVHPVKLFPGNIDVEQ